MRAAFLALVLLSPMPAPAEQVLAAATTIPAGSIIGEGDLTFVDSKRGGLSDPQRAIGMQTRVVIYEGREIPVNALQKPKLITRNQLVKVSYRNGLIRIDIDGRALSEGGSGDVVRVMNLGSKAVINARVNDDGSLSVL